jgi:methyl-accepting chemotaxis protein
MLKNVFRFVNRRLWLRILIPVSLSVILVMALTLWFNISFQNRLGTDQLTTQNKIMAQAVEGGMFDALAIGDNDTVRTQFKRLNEKISGFKVFVYDFNGIISFSSDIDSVGKPVNNYLGAGSDQDLAAMLETGTASNTSFQVILDKEVYTMENDPILNESRCFHCHGPNRKVLGGISVFSSMTSMNKSIQRGKNTSILIGLAGLCVIVLCVWMFFHFLVNKKVQLVLDATTRMREKDFTHEVTIAKGDEVNHILSRINLVTQELRQTILQIVENSGTISSSAKQLSGIADNLNDSSREASEMTSNVSTAAEEMSVGNQSIASAMEDATQSLNVVAAAVDEMSATVNEIAKGSAESKTITNQVAGAFDSILAAVEELGSRANDVDEVTDQIRSISEQVSMLALNAKIEAARAGEAGKGFAVVAHEITDLAADTSKSTIEADEKLDWIKTTSRELTERVTGLAGLLKNSDEAISSIAAAVEEQNVTTLEISKSINEVSGQISQVNDSVNQGAQVATEIARDITKVQDVTVQVQENSGTLNENASALSQLAEKFLELMKQFKV